MHKFSNLLFSGTVEEIDASQQEVNKLKASHIKIKIMLDSKTKEVEKLKARQVYVSAICCSNILKICCLVKK